MKKPYYIYTPKSDSVLNLEKKILRSLNYYTYMVLKDRSSIVQSCRLWLT